MPFASVVQIQYSSGCPLRAGANNYLGLSNHPKLVEAAHKYLDSHGFGLSSVRFICGTQAHTFPEAFLSLKASLPLW